MPHSEHKRIFRGLSAWFSSSVGDRVVAVWRDYGGTHVPDFEDAQFLFSNTPFVDDVTPAFQHQSFILVLHPAFIESCIQAGALLTRDIIKYALPNDRDILKMAIAQFGEQRPFLSQIQIPPSSSANSDSAKEKQSLSSPKSQKSAPINTPTGKSMPVVEKPKCCQTIFAPDAILSGASSLSDESIDCASGVEILRLNRL